MCLLRMRQAGYTMMADARRQGCTVIACGADATDHAGDYLDHGAHFVIRGEGEETLGALLDQQTGKSGAGVAEVAGLAYQGLDGKLVYTPPRPDLRDLDSLPFPAWDLVDLPRYREVWLHRHGYFSLNMVTTRLPVPAGAPSHLGPAL
jgi:radical SAM superfamily enzyme YgiQ (UPF0313 family)